MARRGIVLGFVVLLGGTAGKDVWGREGTQGRVWYLEIRQMCTDKRGGYRGMVLGGRVADGTG